MSVHKKFHRMILKRSNKLCTEKILPYQNQIFKLFNEKFHIDAKKDGERGRKLLETRGNKCGELCNEIHLILGGNNFINKDLKNLVNDIVNLDYNSLSEIFQSLKAIYSETGEKRIANQIEIICIYLEKMWRISSTHITIQKN